MKNKTYLIDKDANFRCLNLDMDFNDNKQLTLQEQAWKEYLTEIPPMGGLFLSNNLFSSLDQKDEIVVLHATTSLDSIKSSKKIYCSGGSFGGCIYSVPLRTDGKLHNLMQFILNDELPGFIKNKKEKLKVDLLAIKVRGLNKNSIMQVNYMGFGEIYSDIFLQVQKEKQFTNSQLLQLKNDIDKQLKSAQPLIEILLDLKKLSSYSNPEFNKLFEKSVRDTIVLKIAYFETILEYCFLFQDDSIAKEKQKEGELSNFNVKNMVFKLNPKLFQEFNLKHFNIPLDEIAKYLTNCSKQNLFITNFSEDHFLNFFKWRFARNVRFHFLKGRFVWNHKMTLQEFVEKNKFLAGHMVLRSPNNPHNFEPLFAQKFWEKMDKVGATLLTYENLPKGEIGLIPSGRFQYEVYNADLVGEKVEFVEKLDVTLTKALINPKQTIMRTHYGKI